MSGGEPVPRSPFSPLRLGVGARLAWVALLLAAQWLAVAWALR